MNIADAIHTIILAGRKILHLLPDEEKWLKILGLTGNSVDEQHSMAISWSSFWLVSKCCNGWNTSDTRIQVKTHLLALRLIGRV